MQCDTRQRGGNYRSSAYQKQQWFANLSRCPVAAMVTILEPCLDPFGSLRTAVVKVHVPRNTAGWIEHVLRLKSILALYT